MSESLENVLVRVSTWLFFGVVLALLPIIVDVMGEMTRSGTAHWRGAVDRGELLLSTTAVAALSTADLFLWLRGRLRLGAAVLTCANLGLIVLATAWYAHLSGLLHHHSSYDASAVATYSGRLFLGAVLFGLCATVTVARREVPHGP